MNTWWQNSPFWNVGVYAGGSNSACGNSRLDTGWVHTVIGQGWNVIPIWNGPHPPCGSGDTFSSATPNADGVSQAVIASNHLQDIHINPNSSGTPPAVYYDLEYFNPSNTSCVADTKSFINGWVNKLHQIGYKAGVYSSACSGTDELWNINDTPDQVWVADWTHDHEDVWGLTCSGAGVSDSHWNGTIDRRLHQYAGNVTKTYGGVTLNVDFNCLNGRTFPNGDGEDRFDDPRSSDPDNESLGGTFEDAECAGPYPTH